MDNSSSASLITIDKLLDSLGFDLWITLIATFLLPIVSIVGIVLCALSLWIFFQRVFVDPVFFYYRLLCLVYIIHLIHNIPYGILFAPRYFPQMNTFLSAMFQIYYNAVTNFMYHYEDTLQMAILLTRMITFSPLVKKHFTAKPQTVALSLFFICLLIDLPIVFTFKISSFGYYFYTDAHGEKRNATFYYFESSDFSLSLYGQIILGLTGFFLNLFLTLVVGVILNIVSYIQYRTYLDEKRLKFEEYRMKSKEKTLPSPLNEQTTLHLLKEIRYSSSRLPETMTQKEIDENKAENNMFRMNITQCSLSIIMRIIFMFVYVYFLFFYSFSGSLLFLIGNDLLVAIEMTISILIFYSFNKLFREEFKKKCSKKREINDNNASEVLF